LEPPELPDVTRQRKVIGTLSVIAMAVTSQLEAYSRWAGQHHDRSSLRAASLLPAEIAGRRTAVKRFLKWVEQQLKGVDRVVLPVTDLVEIWSRSTTGKITRREAELLSEFLERFNYGIEPDVRFAGVEPANLDTV